LPDAAARLTSEPMPQRQQPPSATKRKPSYPVRPELRTYLRHYRREIELPVLYRDLMRFQEGIPLLDEHGQPTLWDAVIYEQSEMRRLNTELTRTYAMLKVEGDTSVMQHLYVDRIDFCTFGNSLPFRIRIVNAYNDNQDYFYLKRCDASRIYGLELEHLVSPNRMHFLTSGDTLVEEHVIGVPGDVFIDKWLDQAQLKPIRVAKELVKFNERCFVRLLGDMRAYNFVAIVLPDFDEPQIRFRAMDFDQQSHHGRKNFYLPQFFPENRPLALFCIKHLNPATALQYQREEQTLIMQRTEISRLRLERLLEAMANDPIAPEENVLTLRQSLAEHWENPAFERCETMGQLVRESLETVNRAVRRRVAASQLNRPAARPA
jgi:hypothetical protein